MQFYERLKNLLNIFREKKSEYIPGMILLFLLFIISSVMNLDYTYMGNKSEKIANIILEQYLFTIITSHIINKIHSFISIIYPNLIILFSFI